MKTQKEQKEKENWTGDKIILRLKEESVSEIFKNENNKKKRWNLIFSIIKRIIMNAQIYLD